MYFLVITEDKDDAASLRMENRNAHLSWLKTETDLVTIMNAGPWLDDNELMKGSFLIVEAASKDDVQRWMYTDPYYQAGLPKRVTIRPYIWVIGEKPKSQS